jgi:DNA repair protein RecO (recombination protein O)
VRTSGLVLGRTNFGNSSQVVTFLTPAHGVVGAVAKGAWRPRNPLFTGPFELGACYELVFIPRRGGSLAICTEAQETEGFRALRRSRERLADAFLVLAFARQFCVPEAGDVRFYELTTGVLRDLAAGARDRLLEFLRKGLGLLGLFPNLGRCASCDAAVRPLARHGFSFREGGVLCARHAAAAEASISRACVELCLSGSGARVLARHETAPAVCFLVDWANFVLGSGGRMLEYPFYLRRSRRFRGYRPPRALHGA